jgi:hypothetical protein
MKGTDSPRSDLSPLKLGSLTALLLVAGTLSTRAWALPVEKEGSRPKPAGSGSSEPAKPSQSREEPERVLQIAPQTDVWHGVSDRPLVQRPSGQPDQFPASSPDKAEVRPLTQARRVESPADPRTRQRCRLICRYAHAPPVEQ